MVSSIVVAAAAASVALFGSARGSEASQAQLAAGAPAARSDSLPRDAAAIAVRARPSAPHVDGRLDDPTWATAPVLTDFLQREPNEGQIATQRTEVRVLYTDDAIYVGVRAFDSEPHGIVGQLTRRDQDSPSDWIAIGFDSYHDRRTAFAFFVNPAGVKRDVYLFNDTDSDDSWDAVWDVATTRDAEGWTAEFRIPFSQLRFARSDSHTFGFQVQRKINRTNELSMWRLVPRNAAGQVSLWGELTGLEGVRPPRRLEILPYSVARGERARPQPANPFNDGREMSASAGADIKYGVTSNLTLDVTINPDFGQVDADPAYVNLSAFEQFLPERRPFFTEGVNIFRFPILLGDGDGANEQLFYSRRVGRSPHGDADPKGGYAERIPNTTILGAAKLSGHTPGGWTIGLLGALTAEEEARVQDSLGQRSQEIVEPRTTYLVGRLAHDYRRGRTVIGLFSTAMHRRLTPGMEWLRSDAYTLGLDFNHRFLGDGYRLRGWVVGSHVRGSTDAIAGTQRSSARLFQRPDNDYRDVDSTATTLTGFASQLSVGKESGNWRWSVGYDTRSPEFEVNDMGFMRQADYLQQFGWLSHRWLRPGRVFRRAQINLNQWMGWNYGGERIFAGGNVNANWQFANYWGGNVGVNRNLGGLNVSEMRGGPAITSPGAINGWGGFWSDFRKPLQGELFGWFWDQEENDSRSWGFSPSLTWRPSGRVELSASPSYDFSHDDWKYLATATVAGATQYVLGEMNQSTVAMGFRANFTFRPTLTLQVYAAPFYSTVEYVGFKRLTNPRAARYADRFQRFGAQQVLRDADGNVAIDVDGDAAGDVDLGHPDFAYTSLRSNVVLRWEYRPGSTIFVVWQQGREAIGSDGRFRLRGFGSNIVDARPDNVFLVKFNYWLSL